MNKPAPTLRALTIPKPLAIANHYTKVTPTSPTRSFTPLEQLADAGLQHYYRSIKQQAWIRELMVHIKNLAYSRADGCL